MELIKNINDTVREKTETQAAAEAAVAEKPINNGKTVSDYLTDIQSNKSKEK